MVSFELNPYQVTTFLTYNGEFASLMNSYLEIPSKNIDERRKALVTFQQKIQVIYPVGADSHDLNKMVLDVLD